MHPIVFSHFLYTNSYYSTHKIKYKTLSYFRLNRFEG